MHRRNEPRKTTDRLVEIVEDWNPEKWYSLASFSVTGKGAAAFFKETLTWESDKSGIYFIRSKNINDFKRTTNIKLCQKLFYIGRAGLIARRLNRHLKVEKHNSASLVYKITSIDLGQSNLKRLENMRDPSFFDKFRSNQNFLREQCELSYFLCENNEDQALLEILFWLRFRTQFNDWITH